MLYTNNILHFYFRFLQQLVFFLFFLFESTKIGAISFRFRRLIFRVQNNMVVISERLAFSRPPRWWDHRRDHQLLLLGQHHQRLLQRLLGNHRAFHRAYHHQRPGTFS